MNRISDFFQHNLPSPRRVALAYAIIVFGLFLWGWLHADSLISERFRILERQKVESQIWILGTNLTHSVSQKLSLVSSKRLVEANDGTLTAESDGLAGKGAIFRTLLPIFENLEA